MKERECGLLPAARRVLYGLVTASIQLAFGLTLPVPATQPDLKFGVHDVRRILNNKSGLPLDVRTQATQLEQYYARKDAKILWLKSERQSELTSALAGLTKIGVSNMGAALARINIRQQALNSQDPGILALVELTFSAILLETAQTLRLGQLHPYRDKLHPRTLQRFIYGERGPVSPCLRSCPGVIAGQPPLFSTATY